MRRIYRILGLAYPSSLQKRVIPSMLSRLPHEVRLKIFHSVFTKFWRCRLVIKVEETAEGIMYKFTSKNDERDYAGAIFCLDADIVGQSVTAASCFGAVYLRSTLRTKITSFAPLI